MIYREEKEKSFGYVLRKGGGAARDPGLKRCDLCFARSPRHPSKQHQHLETGEPVGLFENRGGRTCGFKCEKRGHPQCSLSWIKRSAVVKPNKREGGS